jgi:hypothetical protein
MSHEFLIEKLTTEQKQKINNDLQFISAITQEAKKLGTRVIIHGGYATDGAIGKITRPHNDIDLQIYGNDKTGLQLLGQLLQSVSEKGFDSSGIKINDKKETTFYHNYLVEKKHFGAYIYYIRVKNDPFDNTKIIIKNDGAENESQVFETQIVTLNGISYEAVLPQNGLDDKVKKKEGGEKPRKEIDQDIYNLKLLLEKKR